MKLLTTSGIGRLAVGGALLFTSAGLAQPTTRPTTQPTPTTQPAQAAKWITTDTGLKYRDLRVGTGRTVTPSCLVEVYHRAALEDGTVFEDTFALGRPYRFRVGTKPSRVLRGWDEGMRGMRAGGKRVLLIPPHLAYGLRGFPPKNIPPNATLRLEVELLTVEPPPKITSTKPTDEIALPSGVRYVDLEKGDGAIVTEESVLQLRAATWAPDGTLVSTTWEQSDPLTVAMAGIRSPAIQKGLLGMRAGGKRKLLIPRQRPPTTQPTTAPAPLQMIVEVAVVSATEPTPPAPMEAFSEEEYTTTASGLMYHDIRIGKGDSPQPTSRVKINFAGWLKDGKLFDYSDAHGGAVEIRLDQTLSGWAEGIATMKVGGIRQMIVPPALAYGEEERRGIPPNATLVFRIELLEITEP